MKENYQYTKIVEKSSHRSPFWKKSIDELPVEDAEKIKSTQHPQRQIERILIFSGDARWTSLMHAGLIIGTCRIKPTLNLKIEEMNSQITVPEKNRKCFVKKVDLSDAIKHKRSAFIFSRPNTTRRQDFENELIISLSYANYFFRNLYHRNTIPDIPFFK